MSFVKSVMQCTSESKSKSKRAYKLHMEVQMIVKSLRHLNGRKMFCTKYWRFKFRLWQFPLHRVPCPQKPNKNLSNLIRNPDSSLNGAAYVSWKQLYIHQFQYWVMPFLMVISYDCIILLSNFKLNHLIWLPSKVQVNLFKYGFWTSLSSVEVKKDRTLTKSEQNDF